MPKSNELVKSDTLKLKNAIDKRKQKLGEKDTTALNRDPKTRALKAKYHQSLRREAFIERYAKINADVAAAKAAKSGQ